jgi:ribose transport system substrate-binding protein
VATLVVSSLLLAGCAREATKRAGGTPTVGLVYASTKANFATEMALGYRVGAEAVGGVKAVVTAPPIVDPPRQIEMLKQMSGTATGGITVHPVQGDLFARPMADVVKKDIPLIAIDGIVSPGSKVNLYVGNDNYELGQSLAAEAIKRLKPDAAGTVVVGTPTAGAPSLDSRIAGIRDEFRKQRPAIKVLGPFDTNRDIKANLVVWRGLVKANPKALAFLGVGDADAYNLAAVRQSTGGKWLAAAFDLSPKSLAAVKTGQLFAVVSPEHFLKGAIAGQLQARHAKDGNTLPKGWVYVPGLLVTSQNVEEITKRQASDAARSAWFTPHIKEMTGDIDKYLRPLGEAR